MDQGVRVLRHHERVLGRIRLGVGRWFASGGQARFSVTNEDRDRNPPRGLQARRGRLLLFVDAAFVLRPFRLVSMVLEPDLHLGRRQSDDARQVLPLGG